MQIRRIRSLPISGSAIAALAIIVVAQSGCDVRRGAPGTAANSGTTSVVAENGTVESYQALLESNPRSVDPARWAAIQSHLGGAWIQLPSGDRGENLAKAIACFEASLEVRTREADPAAWAVSQHNLGLAWADLPTGDRGDNLAKAIEFNQNALEVFTLNDGRLGVDRLLLILKANLMTL